MAPAADDAEAEESSQWEAREDALEHVLMEVPQAREGKEREMRG